MRVVRKTCQIFGTLLVLSVFSISSGEETTTTPTISESDLESVTISSNLTVFTINSTVPDSSVSSERNETEIKYKPTFVSPIGVTNITLSNTTTTSTTATPTRKSTTEERYKKDHGGSKEEEEDEEYGEIEVDDDKTEEVEDEQKFTSKASEITLEHIDFVQLRLKHIARSTSNNLTELLIMQKKEFDLNEEYKEGWAAGLKLYNSTKRWELYENASTNSTTLQVPEEYHIALIAYTLAHPTAMYADFNKKTREVCSGKDVGDFHYKSYFKLLLLAIQALGKETKFKSADRFLYRGVGSFFKLEIGQILAFQQFTSTSTSLKVAENFAEETLFEMEGPFHGTTMSIRHHSYFEGEEEVIFSPLQVYQVDSKHVGKHYTRYVLVAYEFKMDGEACGFEPVFNVTKTDKISKSGPGNNMTPNGTTITEKTPIVKDNQVKVVRSAGDGFFSSANGVNKLTWWNGIVLLGFCYKWSIFW